MIQKVARTLVTMNSLIKQNKNRILFYFVFNFIFCSQVVAKVNYTLKLIIKSSSADLILCNISVWLHNS